MLKVDPCFDTIAPLCSNTLKFGACQKFSNCKKRHVFSESDKPINIPCDGLIKFDLVRMRNPAHYIIKIRKFLPQDELKWVNRDKLIIKTEEMMEKLQEHYKLPENRIIAVSASTGELYATLNNEDQKWCRCRVLEKE